MVAHAAADVHERLMLQPGVAPAVLLVKCLRLHSVNVEGRRTPVKGHGVVVPLKKLVHAERLGVGRGAT